MSLWQRLEFTYKPDNGMGYAAVPIVGDIYEGKLQVLFSNRDLNGRSFLQQVYLKWNEHLEFEVDKDDDSVLLEGGRPGKFDEDGVMVCDRFRLNNEIYLHYIGWNLGRVVPFRNALGLAKIETNGSIVKCFDGPILDRSIHDPCFVASANLIKKDDLYLLYYLSCIDWVPMSDGEYRHKYHIKIATSQDGINWTRNGQVAIDFKDEGEYAISVPRVLWEEGHFKMWYSYRGSFASPNYKIGYAESEDGFNWRRMDDSLIIEGTHKIDSEMTCYPYVFKIDGNKFMLYNGNGYGRSGFGIAKEI